MRENSNSGSLKLSQQTVNLMYNLANILTLIRIGLIPFLVVIYYLPFNLNHLVAALIFVLAASTDWLDGYIARTWNQTTRFGAFIDPVADKLIVSTALVLLVGSDLPYMVIPATIIIGREIVVSALREWMAEIGLRTKIAVSKLAKTKTFAQMAAIAFLLAQGSIQSWVLLLIGYVLLYLAAVLTLWSMIVYLRAAWPSMN